MEVRVHRVRRLRKLSGVDYVLCLDGPFSDVVAGQFCMLSTRKDWPVLLPRPFSYFDVEPGDAGFATFLGKAVGPGTRALGEVEPGAEVVVAGPFGRGFPEVAAGAPEPVCVAGGVGLAPFLLWAKQRARRGAGPIRVLCGGATREAIVASDEFPGAAQEFRFATDDGSLGLHGSVLDLLRTLVTSGEVAPEAPVYCCGPEPMLEAVAADCRRRGVRCLVSLETYMACGYGVCNGCVVRVRPEGRFRGEVYAKACIAGPVFDAEEVAW